MSLRQFFRAVAVACAYVGICAASSLGAERAVGEWLRGSGDDLEICLRGEVVDADGAAAKDIQVIGGLNRTGPNEPLTPAIDGNRFSVWIPVNKTKFYSMWLKVATARGDRAAYAKLSAYELRQAAIDGLKLTLQAPARVVEVKVLDGGRPASNATVKAELGFNVELQSTTNEKGIARFNLLPKQELSHLMAWTDDFRIGGFGFDRGPASDPSADLQVVELSRCRPQKLRFIDEQGAGVAGVDFRLQVATPPPHYNYIGTNEHFRMTTDAAGDATFNWFPDWSEHHYYAEVDSKGWVLDGDHSMVDGVTVFKLKTSAARKRKREAGRLVSKETAVGGFFVTLSSFQGEREHYSDPVTAFTNVDGTFAVDVLPDATYDAYVVDTSWVSDITDLIPYKSATDEVTPVELTVAKGQEVEVIATTGAAKKPYANLPVSFRREHNFTWKEDGHTRHGSGGPQWWATTDENGRATTRTLPGTLEASVYTPLWRTEQKVAVRDREPTTIRLHRKNEDTRKFTGRLVLADGVATDWNDVEIRIGSVDGEYEDEQTLQPDADGSFSFETVAAQVGVWASTNDGSAAGTALVKDATKPIEVQLHPTVKFEGQLLDAANQPVAERPVFALVRIEGKEDKQTHKAGLFDVKRLKTTTGDDGKFTLPEFPVEMRMVIVASKKDDSHESDLFETVYLKAYETRPRTTFHTQKPMEGEKRVSLAERYEATKRNCTTSDYRLLRIMVGSGTRTKTFVNQHFVDDNANPELYSCMSVAISRGDDLDAADEAFLNAQKWEIPGEGRVVAYALDAGGKELGHIELAIDDVDAAKAADEFVHQHAPVAAEAEEKWRDAFAEAERTHRRVWVRVSQRHCGPCLTFSRWLSDQHELLSKDYVILKIDDFHDVHGKEVAKRVTRGGQFGVPFHAIFDADGTMLIDSQGPLGNIGCAGGIEGLAHLQKMLLKTRQNLTAEEVDKVIRTLRD